MAFWVRAGQRRIVGSGTEPKHIGSREKIRPSAWIGSTCLDGEDPGDVGPLWVMEDKVGESRTNAVNCGGQQF